MAAIVPTAFNILIYRGIDYGPIQIRCHDENNAILPLTAGYVPYAWVSKKPGGSKVIDLTPSITDINGGIVTIPKFTYPITKGMKVGDFDWDFILQDPDGERLGPLARGTFVVKDIVTEPA